MKRYRDRRRYRNSTIEMLILTAFLLAVSAWAGMHP